MEEHELLVPTESSSPSPSLSGSDDNAYTNEDKYLGAYWLWIHPLFPVLHRSTFDFRRANPLLRAAILALGGQALGTTTDRTNTRILHEQCLKVLKKVSRSLGHTFGAQPLTTEQRTMNTWHTFRVSDMQAVVLVEIYAFFKSRRPPLQFTKPFEDIYRMVSRMSTRSRRI